MRQFHDDTKRIPATTRRGAIAVLATMCLVIVMAFLAFSVDWGYMVVTASELQNAADAGALSGAHALPDGRAAAVAAAQLWAGRNVAAGQAVAVVANEDVEIGLWNHDAASFTALPENSSVSANAVRVKCRRIPARGTALKLLFAPAIGTASASLTATAVAVMERDRCGLMVGIDRVDVQNGHVDSYNSATGLYSAQAPRQNGDVCSDGPITIGPEGEVNGDALPGKGCTVSRPGNVTGSTRPRTRPIKWKPIDVAGPAARNDNGQVPQWARGSGNELSLQGTDSLTLPPGTYYFPGGLQIAGTATLNITGPTRFVLGGESSILGNGIVNQTSVPGNLRIDIFGPAATFSGNAALYADIFAPETDLRIGGSSAFHGAAFARSLSFLGDAMAVHADESLQRKIDANTTWSTLKE